MHRTWSHDDNDDNDDDVRSATVLSVMPTMWMFNDTCTHSLGRN